MLPGNEVSNSKRFDLDKKALSSAEINPAATACNFMLQRFIARN